MPSCDIVRYELQRWSLISVPRKNKKTRETKQIENYGTNSDSVLHLQYPRLKPTYTYFTLAALALSFSITRSSTSKVAVSCEFPRSSGWYSICVLREYEYIIWTATKTSRDPLRDRRRSRKATTDPTSRGYNPWQKKTGPAICVATKSRRTNAAQTSWQLPNCCCSSFLARAYTILFFNIFIKGCKAFTRRTDRSDRSRSRSSRS